MKARLQSMGTGVATPSAGCCETSASAPPGREVLPGGQVVAQGDALGSLGAELAAALTRGRRLGGGIRRDRDRPGGADVGLPGEGAV